MPSTKAGEFMTHRRFLLSCAGMTLTVVLTGPVAAAGGPGSDGTMRGQADGRSGLERAGEVQEQARERHEERVHVRDGNGMEKSKEKSKALGGSDDRLRERDRDHDRVRERDSALGGEDHERSRERDRDRERMHQPNGPDDAEKARRRWWWPFGN